MMASRLMRCISATSLKTAIAISVLSLVFVSYGCQSNNPGDFNSNGPLAGIAFPAPFQLLESLNARNVSAAGQTKTGSEYESALLNNNVSVNDSMLDFNPAWDESGSRLFSDLAYALYLFDGTGLSGASAVTSVWDTAPSDSALYIGIADFSKNRWSWFQPGVASPLAVPDLAPYIDPGDSRIIIAYVLTGTASCTLSSVTLGDAIPEIPLPVVPFSQVPMGGTGLAGPVLADGNPAFGIIEDQNGPTRMIYMRSLDSDGATWGDPVEIAAGSNGNPGLAIIDGNPALVFQSGGGQLMYCRAADAQGTTWNSPIEVDVANTGAGATAELLEIDGRPAIAYLANGFDQFSQPVLYIRADDATGSVWSAAPVVLNPEYTTGEQARYLSFCIIDGYPAVAYNWVGTASGGVRYVRAEDTTGVAWGAPVSIPGSDYVSDGSVMLRNVDMKDLGGVPGILYFIEDFGVPTNNVVYFADAQDASGSAWDAPQVVSQAIVGEDPVNFGSLQVLTMADSTQRAIVVATRDGSVLNDVADVFVATVPPAGGADFSTGVKQMIIRFQMDKGSSIFKQGSCFDSADNTYFLLWLKFVGEFYAQLFGGMVGYDMASNSMGVATTHGTIPASGL